MGIAVETGKAIASVKGRSRVKGIAFCAHAGEGAVLGEIECDCVAMSGGWSPAVHLWSHCGGRLVWDTGIVAFGRMQRSLHATRPVDRWFTRSVRRMASSTVMRR